MSAETYGCIQVYAIKDQEQLRMCCEGSTEYEKANNAWVFGTLLLSCEGFTKNNLWRDRLAYHGYAVAVFGQHCKSLSLQGKELYFAGFTVDYGNIGAPKASGGLLYLIHLSTTSTSIMGSV